MVAFLLGSFLLIGSLVAWICCLGAGDYPEHWLADSADGETQAPVLPPRLDGAKSHGGAIGGPLFFVQRDFQRRFDARKSQHQNIVNFRQRPRG